MVRSLILSFVLLFAFGCAVSRPAPSKDRLPGYKVLGTWYYPLKSAEGYNQKGTASWYGPDFHGKKTANGETYNMHALTAAHTILPLGTRVRVRNLDNGREVVVRINDRGPFVKHRIIDLSYSAAKAIDMQSRGTARVKVTALPPPKSGKGFTLQVGSFSSRSNAQSLVRTLSKKHDHVRIIVENSIYKVHLGNFATKDAAEKAKTTLTAQGYPAFIISL